MDFSTPVISIIIIIIAISSKKRSFDEEEEEEKYQQLLQTLNSQFCLVKFVNLSVSCLGIFGRSAESFIHMCKDLSINKDPLRFIIRKISNIIIRSTYFIFCRRNKP